MEENRAKRKLSESGFSQPKDNRSQPQKEKGQRSGREEYSQESRMEGLKRRVEEARKFNLLSDTFMSVALRDREAAQEVIRTFTGIPDLRIIFLSTQVRLPRMVAHDAILDVVAEDSTGRVYNIEVQRADNQDHARRVRYYESMLDTTCLEKGASYEKLPELYVIYLSEKDLWRGGRTLYTVEKKLSGTDIPYDDGVHITYANAEVKDGTETARTMQYFKESDPMDQSHGALSKRVHYLKCEEGGYQEMCEVAEKIYKEGVAEGRMAGHTEGLAEGEMKKAKETAFMLADRGMSTSDIAEIIKVSAHVVEEWLSGKSESGK